MSAPWEGLEAGGKGNRPSSRDDNTVHARKTVIDRAPTLLEYFYKRLFFGLLGNRPLSL